MSQIDDHREAWESLVAQTLEPNVFYEPGFLMPLLDRFPPGPEFRILFVYFATNCAARELIAVFPLRRERRGPVIPLRRLQLFGHDFVGLCTPLVHRAFSREAIDSLLDWLEEGPDETAVLGLQLIALGGPFGQLLSERLVQRRQPFFVRDVHERALLVPISGFDRYLEVALKAKRRKELRRLRSRLSEKGDLRFEVLRADEDPTPWAEDFLRLEASGWKGDAGTAFACGEESATFFAEAVRRFHRNGRLVMQALSLDGRRIAMKCGLSAPSGQDGAFAFKIAYDEALARFSPGVLLELEVIRQFHEEACAPSWMDSCADPNHPMIDRLWPDRRRIGYLLCAARVWRFRGLFALLAALPGLNRADRWFRARRGSLRDPDCAL